MNINMYDDILTCWAEYEYICSTLKNDITELVRKDMGLKSNTYISVEVKDAVIIIVIKPEISISLLEKIKKIIGIDGKIVSIGSKKDSGIKLIFEKKIAEDQEE